MLVGGSWEDAGGRQRASTGLLLLYFLFLFVFPTPKGFSHRQASLALLSLFVAVLREGI